MQIVRRTLSTLNNRVRFWNSHTIQSNHPCVSLKSALVHLILVALSLVSGAGIAISAESAIDTSDLTAEQREFFERHIRPLLVQHCYECHGDVEEPEGGLRLDSRHFLMRGGSSGAAVVPYEPDESLLIRAVRYIDPMLQMPPDGKLSAHEIQHLQDWVRMGAPDPRTHLEVDSAASASAEDRDGASWWAFQPLTHRPPPRAADRDWPESPVDCFVLAKLQTKGFRPAQRADKRTLIRRATFDLTGLPPTPEQVEAFQAHDRPDSWERLIDRLLASPHYGERWGRHWLDVVRYADTSGCNGDFPVPEAYRYRNYVIDSLNHDKPFDQFIREQIAGDLLPYESWPQRAEQLIATGYLAISRRFSSLGEEFHLTLDDTLDNLGKAVLGLSISCARCHDHKFDPLTSADYYALYGIFDSTRFSFPGTEIYRHSRDFLPLVSPDGMTEPISSYLSEISKLDEEIFRVYSAMAATDTGKAKDKLRDNWKALQEQRDQLLKNRPDFPRAYGATEGTVHNVRIHMKGNPQQLGDEVPRRFLDVLGGQRLPESETGSGRLQLARWITDPNVCPLTVRVAVNRIWQGHFVHGLVRTPNDFGTRGAAPTHPEMLEYLASRFVQWGWSSKLLHRHIMLSSSYRMGSTDNQQFARLDPGNTLLWKFNRRRLDAEEIRDAMLQISGWLDRSRGTPHPFKPEVEWRYTQHRPFVDDFSSERRSVYLMQQRIRLQPYLSVFDGADTNVAMGKRDISTTPLQALFMLNNEFVHASSKRFADRVMEASGQDVDRADDAFRLALGRPADANEQEQAIEYLTKLRPQLAEAGVDQSEINRAAWSSYLRIVMSSNEFVFVD